jgi:hypothetical protein
MNRLRIMLLRLLAAGRPVMMNVDMEDGRVLPFRNGFIIDCTLR